MEFRDLKRQYEPLIQSNYLGSILNMAKKDNGIILNGISKGNGYFYGMVCESNCFVKVNALTLAVEGIYEIDDMPQYCRRCNTDRTFFWQGKVYIVVWGVSNIYVFDTKLNEFIKPITMPDECIRHHNAMMLRDSKIELFPCWGTPRISIDLVSSTAVSLPTSNYKDYNMAACFDVSGDVAYLADRLKGMIYKYDLQNNSVEEIELDSHEAGYLGIKIVDKQIAVLHLNCAKIDLYHKNGKKTEIDFSKNDKLFDSYFSFQETFKNIVVWNNCIYFFSDEDDSILKINPFESSARIIFQEDLNGNNGREYGYYDIYQDRDTVYKTSGDGRNWTIYSLSEESKIRRKMTSEVCLENIKGILENAIASEIVKEDMYYCNLNAYLKYVSEGL